jgi:hypothetical protein
LAGQYLFSVHGNSTKKTGATGPKEKGCDIIYTQHHNGKYRPTVKQLAYAMREHGSWQAFTKAKRENNMRKRELKNIRSIRL